MIGLNQGGRLPPTRYTDEELRAALAAAELELAPPEPAWITAAVTNLRAVRDGRVSAGVEIGGVRLLARVDHVEDADGDVIAYYHLTHRARELLRRGGGLPWGA